MSGRSHSLRALSFVVLGFVAACGASGASDTEVIDEPHDAGDLDGSTGKDAAGGSGGSDDLDASVDDASPDASDAEPDATTDPDAGDGGEDAEADAEPDVDADTDADTPDSGVKGSLELCVLNEGGPFDLCQTPEELDYGVVPAGALRTRSFRIDNETLEEVTFESAAVAHGDFSVVAARYVFDPDQGDVVREVVSLPTKRATGTSLHFEVTFTAKGEVDGPVPADEVVVTAEATNGDRFEITVPIVGEQEACDEGFAVCDSDWTNGCETNTQTDVDHCGECGAACVLPNASAVCAAGECSIDSCAEGHASCNGIDEDGCETNTDADPDHCGGCNSPCPDTVVGDWSICHSAGNECATSGIRRRTITTYTCTGGGCVPHEAEQTESCVRDTEGMSCGAGVTEGPWSGCSRNSSNICDSSGTRNRTVTTQSCASQVCTASASIESESCTMSTTGCHRFTPNKETLPLRGKSGGTAYSRECPAGSVATGIFLKYGTRLDQMILYCSPVNSDGTLGASTALDYVGGTSGGNTATLLCDPGHVMVGLHGKVSLEITQAGPECAPLTEWATNHTGAYKKGPSGNNTGTAFEDTCSNGVITGIDGYFGTWSNNPFASFTVVYSMTGTCTQITVDP